MELSMSDFWLGIVVVLAIEGGIAAIFITLALAMVLKDQLEARK